MKRVARGVWWFALGLAACQSPTAGDPAAVSLMGQWTYAATQTSPVVATLTGALTISQQSGPDFQGSLDAIQQDAQGNLTHVSGIVSGQVLDTAAVEFSLFVGLEGRQHLGALMGDSVRGAWVAQTSGEVTSSGSFVAARRSGP